MSEVKRYGIGTYTDAHEFGEKADGDYILASDYDAREQQWKEVVRELILAGTAISFYYDSSHGEGCMCVPCQRVQRWKRARSRCTQELLNEAGGEGP